MHEPGESAPRGGAHWYGPQRKTYEEAQADADAHNRENPGHEAAVVGTSDTSEESEE